MKISLGTAQFGFNYGIANKTGIIKKKNIKKILNLARSHGIDTIDTAKNYGDCEKVLGEQNLKNLKVISKISYVPNHTVDLERWIAKQLEETFNNLNQKSLYGILVHKSSDLKGKRGEALLKMLNLFKHKGLIKKIGVSIYSPSELNYIRDLSNIDIVQAPMNIFDRRFKKSKWPEKLQDVKIEIHARSIFLQGLLLMSKDTLPKKFFKWKKIFLKWEDWLKNKSKISAVEACLGYIYNLKYIDKIIVGVDNLDHLVEILQSYQIIRKKKIIYPDFKCNDKKILNPFNW